MWDETVNVLEDFFQNVWGDRQVVELDNIMDVTVPVRSQSHCDGSILADLAAYRSRCSSSGSQASAGVSPGTRTKSRLQGIR